MMGKVLSEKQGRFEELYAEYGLQVLAYCRRRISASDAADACSVTFLVAWRRIDDLPLPPRTLPYLYGIAARVVSNQLRTLRRRSRLVARLNALGVAPLADPWIVMVEGPRDAEVVAAVRGLQLKDREIVMLYAWEDLSREAIAEMMGMTRAAIDQRIHRAYRRLARILEQAGEAPTTSPLRSPSKEEYDARPD